MYQLHLSSRELKTIKQLQKTNKTIRVQQRLQTLIMVSAGQSHQQIAQQLNVCIDTITNWIKLYLDQGLAGLCRPINYDRRSSKLDPYIENIKQDIQDHTISTLAQLQDWIKTKYSIELEQSWLFRCCKKNSICLTKRPD